MNDCLNWFLGIGTAEEQVFAALESSSFFATVLPLLAHPNSDIGNTVVSVCHEILHNDEGYENVQLMSGLVVCALKNDLLLLLMQHCQRLNKADVDDNQAVFQALQLVEDAFELLHVERKADDLNLFYDAFRTSSFMAMLIEMFSQDPKAVKTEPFSAQTTPGDAANRFYAAELAATIFQLSATDLLHGKIEAVEKLWINAIDGLGIVEPLLMSLSVYRQRDPVDADEQEIMHNLFDLLGALLLNSRPARLSFSSERIEGFELVKLFLKEINMARVRATQILDYVLAANDSSDLCLAFLNAGGLKVISPIFMGKGVDKLQKKYPKLLPTVDIDEAHACAIISSLFKNTPMQTAAYFRLLAKFVEAGGEKFERLTMLYSKYQAKVDEFDVAHEVRPEDEDEWLLDRMNAGLFVLQQIGAVLLVLVNHERVLEAINEDSTAKEQIEDELFDAVRTEAQKILILEESAVDRIKGTVSGWLKELQDPHSVPLASFLKDLCQ